MCSFKGRRHTLTRTHTTVTVIESRERLQMTEVLQQKCAMRRTKFEILWGFFPLPLLSFIFLPVSYLFVAECISLTSLAVCVLLTRIALLLLNVLNVLWLGVEKGIVSCCQSTRLQLQRILIAQPPKISRWLLTSPARRIWRCLIFFFFPPHSFWEVQVQNNPTWETKWEV